MSLAIIRSTLMTELASYAAAHTPALTISREDIDFTKPTDDTPFLEAYIIPATTDIVTVSADRKRFLGIFAINIWVKESLGPGVAETIAAELEALFTVFPKTLLPVSIESPLRANRAILSGDGYRILPCDLTYRLEV